MRWLVSTANKWMPVAFIATAILGVVQFWMQHGPSSSAFSVAFREASVWLHLHAWLVFTGAALFWLPVFAGYFHERHRNLMHHEIKRGWTMDVLDRLTNRQALEEKLAKESEAIFIDAEKLAEALKEPLKNPVILR